MYCNIRLLGAHMVVNMYVCIYPYTVGSRSPDSIVKFIIDYVAKLKVYPPLKLIEYVHIYPTCPLYPNVPLLFTLNISNNRSNKVDSTLNFLFFEKRDSHIGSMVYTCI